MPPDTVSCHTRVFQARRDNTPFTDTLARITHPQKNSCTIVSAAWTTHCDGDDTSECIDMFYKRRKWQTWGGSSSISTEIIATSSSKGFSPPLPRLPHVFTSTA